MKCIKCGIELADNNMEINVHMAWHEWKENER